MNPETWHALRESFELGLLMLSQGTTLLIGLASVLFIVLCLGGAAWGCCAQARRFARRPQPAPDAYDALVTPPGRDDSGAGERVHQPLSSMHQA